jgi:hypothetical protein
MDLCESGNSSGAGPVRCGNLGGLNFLYVQNLKVNREYFCMPVNHAELLHLVGR